MTNEMVTDGNQGVAEQLVAALAMEEARRPERGITDTTLTDRLIRAMLGNCCIADHCLPDRYSQKKRRQELFGDDSALSEDKMQKIELCLYRINRIKDIDRLGKRARKRELVIIRAMDEVIRQEVDRILQNQEEDGKPFNNPKEISELYTLYQKQFATIDKEAGKSFVAISKLLICLYTISGFATSASSVERLTRDTYAAIWLILTMGAGSLNAYSQYVFAQKLLEMMNNLSIPFYLIPALATAFTPSIPVLNAVNLVPENMEWITKVLGVATFLTTLPIFVKDYVRVHNGAKYYLNNLYNGGYYALTHHPRDSISKFYTHYLSNISISDIAKTIGLAAMCGLGGFQSNGYTSVAETYFDIEDWYLKFILLAARIPFVLIASNNAIEGIEKLLDKGLNGLPDNFKRDFTMVLLNSIGLASVFVANSRLFDEFSCFGFSTIVATIIFGTAARLSGTLESKPKGAIAIGRLISEYVSEVSGTDLRQMVHEARIGDGGAGYAELVDIAPSSNIMTEFSSSDTLHSDNSSDGSTGSTAKPGTPLVSRREGNRSASPNTRPLTPAARRRAAINPGERTSAFNPSN